MSGIVVVLGVLLAGCGVVGRTHPNILVILADDQGWGDLSVNGNTNLATPNIDSLAKSGAMIDRFYVSPVCSPTRAEFLTGRYHTRGGVRSTSSGGERLDLDEHTIGEAFQAAGYATGAFGKWHNGTQAPYHPNSRGFEEFYGFTSGHWPEYFNPVLDHNGEIVRGEGFIIDDLTSKAMAFIEANRGRPFFCYVPYNTPHSPMQVPDRFYKKFAGAQLAMHNRDPKREKLPHIRAALAMVENIDWNVGRLLQRLKELDLERDTIVIYFSDNGPNGWRWNGGMKGRKGSVDEGGVRSPFLIRWPGHIKPGLKVTKIAAAIDLLPTLADLARIDFQPVKPLDGMSIAPLLTGEAKEWPDRMIFSYWKGRASVRTQQYRMDRKGHLFDMTRDPGQRNDIAKQEPDLASRLGSTLETRTEEAEAELGPKDTRPFTVGWAPLTLLPARDGVPSGHIRRSDRFPNSSYFLDWTSLDDRIRWDIEVGREGRFEAAVYYACPAADTGSTVELSFQGNSVANQVTKPNDPPLIGASDDRTPRMESYTKDFRPLKLGVITLPAGRGELTLRATKIPGRQVMEVQMVTLRRLE